jgi:outer membrane protein TolC
MAQLERARRQVRAGVAADVEVIRAESGVADRVEAIISAQNAIRLQQRDLKRIVNSPDLPMDSDTTVIPLTEPNRIPYALDGRELVEKAMSQRMDLLETELQIAAETANIKAARNATLPLVSLQYTYTVNGLGGTLGDAWGQVGDFDFQGHTVGLQVEIPIGNEAARSRLRAAIARRLQQLATREQRRAQIEQEIYNALDTLRATWQRIIAARQRVVLAARTMDAETRQFQEGLRTSTEVLNAQADLANAQLAEISSLTDYQIAQIDIAFATGTLLGAARVQWNPATRPAAR